MSLDEPVFKLSMKGAEPMSGFVSSRHRNVQYSTENFFRLVYRMLVPNK